MAKREKRATVNYEVTRERYVWKLKHLTPTKFQDRLLAYVREKKELPFSHVVGLNWTMTGGLLSRGILIWERRSDGMWLVPNKDARAN